MSTSPAQPPHYRRGSRKIIDRVGHTHESHPAPDRDPFTRRVEISMLYNCEAVWPALLTDNVKL